MSYGRKLLIVFALTIVCSVAAVAWIVAAAARRAFEKVNAERAQALVAQFQREFNRRGDEVAQRAAAIAANESTVRMAQSVSQSGPDYAAYLHEAKSIATAQRLDFLEFVDQQGAILSSAQAPAKYGYKDETVNLAAGENAGSFLKLEQVANDSVLGIFAVRAVDGGSQRMYVAAGEQIDRGFLATLDLPAGMRAWLYQYRSPTFSPQDLLGPESTTAAPESLAPLVLKVQQQGRAATEVVQWTSHPEDDETVDAIPLRGQQNQILAALIIGSSRRSYVELERRIRSIALLVGGAGVLVAILLSSWAAARFSRPIGELASAARQVADGNWDARVDLKSRDELGELADAFNRMTRDLLDQKERLVQAERVAAWREVARRLAHELKNPLFPLQITVENLLRAREQSPEIFDEIFRESTSTLLAEIANLKNITGRFSDFSNVPQPNFQSIDLNELIRGVARLFDAQLSSHTPPIRCDLELDDTLPHIAADPDLLHKAISNLFLNAIDAMTQGGDLKVRTVQNAERIRMEVSDTGAGLTREECDRLFTPYYTTKQHGTGLGLAIVQSVISDHGGKISVDSAPARGTTFRIDLPLGLEKLTEAAQAQSGV